MPTPAVSQMLAAVVRPWTSILSLILRMVPAPRNPMPAMMPWMTRLEASWDEARGLASEDHDGRAEADEDVRAQACRALDLLAVDAEDGAERRGQAQAGEVEKDVPGFDGKEDRAGLGHAQSPGPTMFSGFTSRSNSSAVR